MNGRDRILSFLDGRAIDGLPLMPITMMFAADHVGVPYGRYAADYRTLVDAQIATARAYDFDYVSCISDPAREAADCGAKVQLFDDQPPAIVESEAVLADKAALARLAMPDPLGGGRMTDRVRAAELFEQQLDGERLIEGWVEGPCAEAADLRGINTLMLDFIDDPAFVTDLFEFCVEMALAFSKAQIEAGADLIGVGDAAASLVGPRIYNDFVLPFERRLVDGLHRLGGRVRLHVCGNITRILEPIGTLECDVVDLDFMVPVADARAAMGDAQVLLGNLDPVRDVRDGTPESIRAALAECRRQAGPRFIVGAGCEITRDTPAENVRAMTRFARNPAV